MNSFAIFPCRYCFWVLGVLYILDINSFSGIWFWNISSNIFGLYFYSTDSASVSQIVLMFTKSIFSIFILLPVSVVSYPEIYAKFNIMMFSYVFLQGLYNFMPLYLDNGYILNDFSHLTVLGKDSASFLHHLKFSRRLLKRLSFSH